MSYEDAANNALSMYTAMFTGHMPPWPADPDYRHFVGETVVTDEEVAMLLEWLEEGLPYGDRCWSLRPLNLRTAAPSCMR